MHRTRERPDAALWKTFCDADPSCTYFQTPSWIDLLTSLGVGWRNDTVLLRFPHGVEAIVPRVTRQIAGGVFRVQESVPPGVYGAPILRGGSLDPEHLAAVADLFRGVRCADAALTEVPGHPLDLGARRQINTTHLLRFAPHESESTLLARYRKGHRNDVLNARREGVEVAVARTEDEVDGYCRLYTETVSRWDRTPYIVYPATFFHGLHLLAESGERIRIWLSRRGDELLAGVIVLVHGRHAAYWHAVSTEAGRAAHASHLALHTAIVDALSLGAAVFDFMPSAGLSAVERFKTGFDASSMAVGVHRFPGSRPYRFMRWVRKLSSVRRPRHG